MSETKTTGAAQVYQVSNAGARPVDVHTSRGSKTLIPGVTPVPAEIWEKFKTTRVGRALLGMRSGGLRDLGKGEDISALDESAATRAALASTSAEQLNAWKQQETRPGVLQAIDEQLDKVAEEAAKVKQKLSDDSGGKGSPSPKK